MAYRPRQNDGPDMRENMDRFMKLALMGFRVGPKRYRRMMMAQMIFMAGCLVVWIKFNGGKRNCIMYTLALNKVTGITNNYRVGDSRPGSGPVHSEHTQVSTSRVRMPDASALFQLGRFTNSPPPPNDRTISHHRADFYRLAFKYHSILFLYNQ